MQAMATADPKAKWLMQAWLFYDNQEFWKPPQIKVCTACLSNSSCSQLPCRLIRLCNLPAHAVRVCCELAVMLSLMVLRYSQKALFSSLSSP